MARLLLNAAVLMIMALPVAASAQSGTILDCAVDRADPALRQSLAGALIGDGDDAAFDALVGRFSTVADGCTAGMSLDDVRKKAYLDYGLSRVLREWLAGELAGFGLSAATIDDTLGLGEGRPNPVLRGQMNEDQVKALVQALIEGGIDAENLSPPAWNSVGTYAAASSLYWRRRAQVFVWALGSAPSAAIAVVAAPAPSEPAAAPTPAAPGPMAPPTDAGPAPLTPLATEPVPMEPIASEPVVPDAAPIDEPAAA